jgi:nitrite reductase (NADH) large subunit
MKTQKLVVIGNGMVGHRFVEELVKLDVANFCQITVVGEEAIPAYDRVALSSFFDGMTADDLALGTTGWYSENSVRLILDERVVAVDRAAKLVRTDKDSYAYDVLVLATGSVPFVPPIEGRNRPGAFVYRTIDDLIGIRQHASLPHVRNGVVVGGGLLGLEAANALRLLGLETHVVEFASRLMPLQLCPGGAAELQTQIEQLGLTVTMGAGVTALLGETPDGPVTGAELGKSPTGDPIVIPTELVVFSAGVRPRDELARGCGLDVGERGGIVVDERCVTSDPSVLAIGECALAAGRVWGLVAPGYDMARVAAATVSHRASASSSESESQQLVFVGADLSTKLKLLGIDVVSFGDAHGSAPGATNVVFSDPTASTFRRLVLDADGVIRGGVLVGDADGADMLAAVVRGEIPSPADARLLVLPSSARSGVDSSNDIPNAMRVCSCNAVSAGTIRNAVTQDGLTDSAAVQRATTAGTGCGGCVALVKRIVDLELAKNGIAVSTALCEHFSYSRVQLFDIVRSTGVRRFDELIASHGTGLGCAVCKPTVASMFASLGAGYVLDAEQASLQDSNDHFLANLQRDGSYSVVPRVPGGEITPKQLMAIASVADEFNLYTKITGGQRIDLFGARVEQLPIIWRRLIDAGLESGHAYGKALRTVKSCVGQTWCRYGVQDSTQMAIQLELRYRGLRAPHKLKMAVSGCTRECAEAQSKDVGVIATERGWNLYVSGNGGMRPRHADLLAEDLNDKMLIRYIDRFFAFYIRTADRLERTSTWLSRRPGGIDELRSIICDDSLHIATELEAMIEHHVSTYECEWTATLADTERLEMFRSFVNSDEPDDGIVFTHERGQIRPAPVLVSIGDRR